jgi:hypothetical protein
MRSVGELERSIDGWNGLIIPDTSKDTLYTVFRGEYEREQQTQTPQI